MSNMLYFVTFVLCVVGIAVSFQKERNNRELQNQDKNLFRDIHMRLSRLEKSIESRKCSGNQNTGHADSTVPGTTYVRWGRSSCGGKDTNLVYSGIIGGSHFAHKGGAAEYLCLPETPEWGLHIDGHQGFNGYIYGAEYRMYKNSFLFQYYDWYEVPCAVCEVTGRTRHLMVPGMKSCQKGWTKEYTGYIMSGFHDHPSATEYICVDKNAHKTGSASDRNGRLLYMVEAKCGSLPCPPYVDGRESTCVVCTK